ncbi:GGDEF domain-containing protein [Bhargavaea ullalensis]|uniref:Diguanylate cyclase n=1 Tax=Bhargavaea ullalensis TaxID=1265685 RepID=A0ABV2GBT6_9BACL
MLYQLAVNFCILFTFSIISYWPFQDRGRFRIPYPKLHPVLIGLTAGVTATFLLAASVRLEGGVFVDARISVIVISGIFGGPVAPVIAAAVVGLVRIGMSGFAGAGLVAGLNAVFIGIAASGFFAWKGSSFRTARLFFHFAVLETAVVLIFLLPKGAGVVMNTAMFIAYSYLSYFTVTVILRELNSHFKKLAGIEKLSKTDFLTGLNNSRSFGEIISSMLEDGTRPVSLVLFDIDRFKKVNDTYGHPVGDEVLTELAGRIRRCALPKGAVLSRNGGEEFSVLLPGIAEDQALSVAEKLRRAVAGNPFILDGGLSIPVTISLGVCSFPGQAEDTKQLYQRADEALYTAKQTGRNRVVAWTPRTESIAKT